MASCTLRPQFRVDFASYLSATCFDCVSCASCSLRPDQLLYSFLGLSLSDILSLLAMMKG